VLEVLEVEGLTVVHVYEVELEELEEEEELEDEGLTVVQV